MRLLLEWVDVVWCWFKPGEVDTCVVCDMGYGIKLGPTLTGAGGENID